jgi:hypothetical protein
VESVRARRGYLTPVGSYPAYTAFVFFDLAERRRLGNAKVIIPR